MTLSFGTKVTDRNADPDAVGVVLRLANDAAEYGEEEYVVMWQSGLEELLHRRDLVVVPDPNAMRIVPASDRHSRTRPNHAPGGLVSKDAVTIDEMLRVLSGPVVVWDLPGRGVSVTIPGPVEFEASTFARAVRMAYEHFCSERNRRQAAEKQRREREAAMTPADLRKAYRAQQVADIVHALNYESPQSVRSLFWRVKSFRDLTGSGDMSEAMIRKILKAHPASFAAELRKVPGERPTYIWRAL